MAFREFLTDTLAYMPPARILDGLTADDAMRRPAAGAHTIAEVLAHAAFWQAWFLDRCRGVRAPMTASAAPGWPPVTADDWPALKARWLGGLEAAAALSDEVDALDRPLEPAIEFPPLAHYTRRDALTHLAVHNAHHLGQVVLLRQLIGRWPPPAGSWTW